MDDGEDLLCVGAELYIICRIDVGAAGGDAGDVSVASAVSVAFGGIAAFASAATAVAMKIRLPLYASHALLAFFRREKDEEREGTRRNRGTYCGLPTLPTLPTYRPKHLHEQG